MILWALLTVASLAALVVTIRGTADRWLRRHPHRIGRWSDVLPGWKDHRCGRCRTSYRYIPGHALRYEGYDRDGRPTSVTVVAMCQPCHVETTPGQRIVFYEDVWEWMNSGERQHDPRELMGIRAAVAVGA